MKKIFTTGLVLLLFLGLNAQQNSVNIPADADTYPYWIEMMQDDDVNFWEAKAAFETYMAANEIKSGWKPFARWLSRMETKVDYRDGSLPDFQQIARNFKSYNQTRGARSTNGNWKELGPAFSDYTTYGHIFGVGRLNGIGFHPTDTNKIWVGAPAGGLWYTEDGGLSWTSNTDDLPSLGVSSIVVNPKNPQIIYIGTGDRDADDAPGFGVMKSIDGGQSWFRTDTSLGDLIVGAMLIHPENPDTLLAGAEDGVYRTTDGGQSWTKTSSVSLHFKDLQFKPDDPNIVYGEARGRFYRSDDNGQSWTQITNGILLAFRQVIGVSPADPNRVYVLQSYQREFRAFYRSDDAGLSFYPVIIDTPNILGRAIDGSDDEGQSWYDLCIEVDPNNADIVYSGGIQMFRSDDGGQSWKINGYREDQPTSRLHVDQHDYAFHPITHKLYVANDGGIYVSKTGNNGYKSLSMDMGIGQIYKMGGSALDSRLVLTGFQDNGTSFYDGARWNRTTGADGFECAYDPYDEDYRYTSIYYGDVYRSVNMGQPRKIAGNDVNDIDETGNWVTPFTLAEHNSNSMFIGYYSIWRSDNLKAENHGDVEWRKISGRLGVSNSAFNEIEHSPADSNLLFCSKGVWLWKTHQAMDTTAQWDQVTPGTSAFSISDITCHPRSADTVYLVQGSKVFRSSDTGSSWVDISGSLPDIPMNTLIFDEQSKEGLYLGGDAGVYFYDEQAKDWLPFYQGLPNNVPVTELEIYYGSSPGENRLRAATYGRGLWETDLIGASIIDFPPVAAVRVLDEKLIYHEGMDIEFSFFRGIDQIEMTGFDMGDVIVENATLSGFQGGPKIWTASLNPVGPGTIKVFVPNQIATDLGGVDNAHSDTLKIAYEGVPKPLGIHGPGGIGDGNTLSLWLRADTSVFVSQNGSGVSLDGERLGYWMDLSGKNIVARQDSTKHQPSWRSGAVGGRDGIEFKPDSVGQFLIAEGVVPGVDFTAVTIAQSNTNEYNDHNWISSARMNSGFNLHVTKNSKYWYPVVVDGTNSNLSRDRVYLDDLTIPHIFGVTFDQTEVRHQYVAIADEEDLEQRPPTFFVPRRSTDSINIKYGWDFKQRYGDGLVAEAIVLNRRIYSSHSNILRNYFSARYGIDIGDKDFYAHDLTHAEDVAGLGREHFYDFHHDAKGLGIVRFRNAYDLGDGEYMIWGHDQAPRGAWVNQNVPAGFERIERSWRLDKTGVIGKAELLVMKADLPASAETLGVLVAEDGNFSQGVYALPFTEDGDTLKASLFMPDDAWFTFVSAPESLYQQYTSVEELGDQRLVLYPNPSNDFVKVGLIGAETQTASELVIFDMSGRIVLKRAIIGEQEAVLDISLWPAGVYQVQWLGENSAYNAKLIRF